MLCLSRKKLESVVIFDPVRPDEIIRVTMVEFKSKQMVRLGFEAPKNYLIRRSEIHKAIQEQAHVTENLPQAGQGVTEATDHASVPTGRIATAA